MTDFDTGWPENFPPVMRFVDRDFKNDGDFPLGLVKQEPDYYAAKNLGDREAAARLVEKFLARDVNVKQLALLKAKFPDAVIVPVHAVEGKSTNRIPMLLAAYIAKQTGIESNYSIVKQTRTHNTGSNAWHRLAFRADFDGNVQPGRRHILIDDVFAYGGTLNELRLFIEKRGGTVVQTAALTLGHNGNIIALQPETRDILLYKFKENRLVSFLKDKEINLYDGNYRNLTEPEACLIGNTHNLVEGPVALDAARNRIIAARRERIVRMGDETLRERQTVTVTWPPPNKPDRGFRR
jgi:hypothetical protein